MAAQLDGSYGGIMGASIGSTSIMGYEEFVAGAQTFLQSITANVDVGAFIYKNALLSIIAGVDCVPLYQRNTGKKVNASVLTAMSFSKHIFKTIIIGCDVAGLVLKGLYKDVTVSVVSGAVFVRNTGKHVSAGVGTTVSYSRSVAKKITAGVDALVTIQKHVFTTILAGVVAAAEVLAIKVRLLTIIASVAVGVSFKRTVSHHMTALIKTAVSFKRLIAKTIVAPVILFIFGGKRLVVGTFGSIMGAAPTGASIMGLVKYTQEGFSSGRFIKQVHKNMTINLTAAGLVSGIRTAVRRILNLFYY